MSASRADLDQNLGELKAMVQALTERLDALEARVAAMPDPSQDVPLEVLAVISAACAAYLGKRATVKQVHLRRDAAWARQGRSGLQHSHQINYVRR